MTVLQFVLGWVCVSAIVTALWVVAVEVGRWRQHRRVQSYIRTVVAEIQAEQERRAA